MVDSETILNIFGTVSMLTLIPLGIVLIFKGDKEKQLQSEINRLRKSLEEMDEQAKLVVRTDLELNKAQEELDKKITSLYALQQLSRSISTTLEEQLIFKRIDSIHLEDLGFERGLAFLWEETENTFPLQLNIGYDGEELQGIMSFIEANKTEFTEVIRSEKTFSSITHTENTALKDSINKIFSCAFFVVAPILPKDGTKGFLFVGTENVDVPLTEGDEESITILTNQIGQALENARLFEKTWKTHQELEKRVEERTRQLMNVLEEVKNINQRKTDFVSSVSHELRTPLTSIKGYASILLTGKLGVLPEDVKLRLEKINRHSDELVHLVNDLLDISRIESGRVTMKQETLDIKKIAEEVLDLLAVQAKEKQLELTSFIDETSVFADRNQIQRVLINLINNAIKYTPTGGKISVKSSKTDSHIQIDVIDNGYGISAEGQKKLFQEFYRVDNAINQQIKGTGLGLALVKHIIEAHKGRIWVTSKDGEGSTFSFTLPIAAQ